MDLWITPEKHMWLYFIRERLCGIACSGLCANGYIYFNAFFPCWFFYQFGSTEGDQYKLYAIKMASVEPLKWHNSQSLISQLSNCINFLGCLKTWLFISSYEKCELSRPDESQCSQAYSHLPKEIATASPAKENCSRTLSQLWRHITIPGELWKMSLSRLNPTDSNFKALVNPGKWSEVAQSCPTLCDPVDCSLPGSSVHGILQARIMEWVAISFSNMGSNF